MTTSPSAELWPSILQALQKTVREQQFETWFKPLELRTISSDELCLRVPNNFYKAWLAERYVPTIRDAVYSVTGRRPEVRFLVQPQEPAAAEKLDSAGSAADSALKWPSNTSDSWQRAASRMRLNPWYTFANFVVGPSNSLPHAAALAVSESPSQAYNPLFLHSSVGMGKTHLIHAICHALLLKRSDLKILYLSCEGFVNHFISAVEHKQIEQFRYRYRHVDVLLVDDIHALQGKERTQEEFFHTFNTLHNDQKQIVLCSDSPPAEIPKLEERLVSRFNWGLITKIDPPTYETRVAIVKKKCQQRGRHFPNEVVELIASSVDKNIRELEGAVVTVIGHASLSNKRVDLALARSALRDTVRLAHRRPGMDSIIEAVMSQFQVRLSDLQSKKRTKTIVFPRQVCMYLARQLTDLSLAEIGGYFGGRDHTTVLHACDRVSQCMAADQTRSAQIALIERSLKNPQQ